MSNSRPQRRSVYREGYWQLDTPIASSWGVHDGELIAVSGQVDMHRDGRVGHTRLAGQAAATIDHIRGVLESLDCDFSDLVKLVVFYAQHDAPYEEDLRDLVSGLLDKRAEVVLTLVPLRYLGYPGIKIEIDAYAMRDRNGSAMPRVTAVVRDLGDPGTGLCHGLRCGEFIFVAGQSATTSNGKIGFPDDLVSQNRQVLEKFETILAEFSAGPADIVKVNSWRAPPASNAAYVQAARDRFDFLQPAAPAVTGITVPGLRASGCLIRLDLWAMLTREGHSLPHTRLQPENHWDWKLATGYSHGLRCGDWLFVGGQAALDEHGEIQQPGKPIPQTRITMDFVERILREGDTGFDDVLKLNTYYCGTDDATRLHENLQVRNACFNVPGPASTGVPVDNLAYPGQEVEVEAIAHFRRR